ncbi:MAG: acyl-CoA dehydrogenase family protein [Thalassobaculum sp.]
MSFALTPAQEELRARARDLAETVIAPRAAEVDRSEQYPWDNVKALTEAGFMGMTVPKELGGKGYSFLDVVLVIEEMAAQCGVTGRIVVEGNMGGDLRPAAVRHRLAAQGSPPSTCCPATSWRSASRSRMPAPPRPR